MLKLSYNVSLQLYSLVFTKIPINIENINSSTIIKKNVRIKMKVGADANMLME